jgi:hypothetical protein
MDQHFLEVEQDCLILEKIVSDYKEPKDRREYDKHLQMIKDKLSVLRLDYYAPKGTDTNKDKFKQIRETLRKIKNDLDFKTPSSSTSFHHREDNLNDTSRTDVVIHYAEDLQKKNLNSLQFQTSILLDTIEIGKTTTTTLASQGEQLKKMHDTLDEIEEAQTRASRIVRKILRKAVNSRLLQLLTLLIIVLIIVVIYIEVR